MHSPFKIYFNLNFISPEDVIKVYKGFYSLTINLLIDGLNLLILEIKCQRRDLIQDLDLCLFFIAASLPFVFPLKIYILLVFTFAQ